MCQMSGTSIRDYAGDYQAPNLEGDVDLSGGEQIELPQPEQPSKLEGIFEKLKTETGEGEIEDYYNVPLNFGKTEHQKRAIARILRGATGFLGSLNYAIIDVVMGVLELNNTKGASHVNSIHTAGSPSGVNN